MASTNSLRRVVHDGIFIPRELGDGAQVINIQSGAFIVPLEWSYTKATLFEKELIELFKKYNLIKDERNIKAV